MPVVFALITVLGGSTADGFVPQGLLSRIFKKPAAIQRAKQNIETLKKDPGQPLETMINEARLLERQGEYAESIKRYRTILELAPDSAISHHSLAVNLDRIGNIDESQAHYKEALRLQPDNPEVVCDYGYSLYLRGNVDAAVQQYREALRINPRFQRAHNNLGMVYAKNGDRDDAFRHFQLAGCDPMQAEFNFSFGSHALTQSKETGVRDVRQAQYTQQPSITPNSAPLVADVVPKVNRTPISADLPLPPAPVPNNQPTLNQPEEAREDHLVKPQQKVAKIEKNSTEDSVQSQPTSETTLVQVANVVASPNPTPIAPSLDLPPIIVPVPIVQPTNPLSHESSVLKKSSSTHSAALRSDSTGTNELTPIVDLLTPSKPVLMNFRSGAADTDANPSEQEVQPTSTENSGSIKNSTDDKLSQPLEVRSRLPETDLLSLPGRFLTPNRQTITSPLKQRRGTVNTDEKDTTTHDQGRGPNAEMTERQYQTRQVSYLSVDPDEQFSSGVSKLAIPPAPRIKQALLEGFSETELTPPQRDEMTGNPEYLISDPIPQLTSGHSVSESTNDPYFAQADSNFN